MTSALPGLRAQYIDILMVQPVDWLRLTELQEDMVTTLASERHALGLIEAAKDLVDGPYDCGYPGCEDGWVRVGDIAVFADGGYSDVEPDYQRCPVCNRVATDEDYELAVTCGLLDAPTDEEHPLYQAYCDEYNVHLGDWEHDTPAYRLAHMPEFPAFATWLAQQESGENEPTGTPWHDDRPAYPGETEYPDFDAPEPDEDDNDGPFGFGCPANNEPSYLDTHPWHDDRPGYPGETPYPDFPCPVVDFDTAA